MTPKTVPYLPSGNASESEGQIRCGDIGPVRREITFEPLPDDVPVEVPEPEKVPA